MIFCAVTGPTPGNVSSCSAVAELRETGPRRAPPPRPRRGRRDRRATRGTSTCWPSETGAAKLTPARSVPRRVRRRGQSHRRPARPPPAGEPGTANCARPRRRRAAAPLLQLHRATREPARPARPATARGRAGRRMPPRDDNEHERKRAPPRARGGRARRAGTSPCVQAAGTNRHAWETPVCRKWNFCGAATRRAGRARTRPRPSATRRRAGDAFRRPSDRSRAARRDRGRPRARAFRRR